ncbi:MAG: hypothetical protein NTV48_01650 [Candidatus Vogelbacteria bacterium]|nr:hypothetical protein [Candidatus Vogelbacteria bacterium]
MKIVSIIPINKAPFKGNLTYFTSQEVKLGTIVSVPVKNKEIDGIVVEIKEAKNLKSQIRKGEFGLKKISRIKSSAYFLPEFVSAISDTADFFASPTGQTFKNLVPKIILENLEGLKIPAKNSGEQKDGDSLSEKMVLQESEEERLSFYKSLIRESFARKQSVLLCAPTTLDIKNIASFITKGIEQYSVIIHNQLPKKELLTIWKKATNSDHPLLIIASPMFLSLPRKDICTIIIDHESSSAYKNLNRPFIDYRYFAEQLAKHKKIKIIFGDISLRSETIYRAGKGELAPASAIKYRVYSETKQIVVPLIQTDGTVMDKQNSLSETLLAQIENSHDQSQRMFVFSGRRGLAPLTICNDCGTALTCDVCHSPLFLHHNLAQKSSDRIFSCHKCSQIVEVADNCTHCGGWRLAVVGYGLEKIIEELKEKLPKITYFRLDSDTVKTPKQAEEIIAKFIASPGSVLVGTEMVVNYLREKIENIAIANIDSFFAMPDFRISEKLFNLLLRLRSFSTKRFTVQTRNPDEKVFHYVTTGNLLDFYRDEIAERQALDYPPFKILIKISREGKKDEVTKEMAELEKQLIDYGPLTFPNLKSTDGKTYSLNILLRLEPTKWPEPKLLAILKNLPPSFLIKVDPESIL